MKLSAIIITKNEEANIGRCIASLSGVADEIVVVDSFSTDKTKEICESHHVVFAEREFKDYSDAKNHGNHLASGDYILSIDADEEISDQLKSSLLKIKNSPGNKVYSMNRLTNYCGSWINHCGWYPDNKERLWKKGEATWEGKVHETLQHKLPVEKLKGDLLHYSYPSLSFHVNKINHFTDFMAEEAFRKGKKGSVIKLIVSPPFKFLKKYFFQLGFMDGYAGFVVSVMAAYYVFLKYAKLIALKAKS